MSAQELQMLNVEVIKGREKFQQLQLHYEELKGRRDEMLIKRVSEESGLIQLKTDVKTLRATIVATNKRAMMTSAEFDAFQTKYNALVDILNANEDMHRELINFNGWVVAKMDDAEKGVQSKMAERAALQLEVEKRTADPAIDLAKLDMMEAEIKQLTQESVRLTEKMADDDRKIAAHQTEKEKISEEFETMIEATHKAQQEFATLEGRHASLTEQLFQMKAKEAELLQSSEPMMSVEEMKVEVEEAEGAPSVLTVPSDDEEPMPTPTPDERISPE